LRFFKLDNEQTRLNEVHEKQIPWRKWGPYLSERQWGTVREDYSENGAAWDYFSHDQSRSRTYRWGEDGLGGISDDKQLLCFALALWNGKDPILKERLFGLTNSEGNHGEDVKEYYFYLDSTPTHSYMKFLYKYPQKEYPYMDLIQTNKSRDRFAFEYELMDTGIFNGDCYFDIFVEYAKESPEDILIQITACNRGKDTSTLHLLPTLWFRNTWSADKNTVKSQLRQLTMKSGINLVEASAEMLGKRYLYFEGEAPLLFTENETNTQRLFGTPNSSKYVKDGINDYVVNNDHSKVNPEKNGTKAAAHYHVVIGAGEKKTIRLRLTNLSPENMHLTQDTEEKSLFGRHFEEIFRMRKQEADEFYDFISPANASDDERNVLRQSLSGMLWSKQYYNYDVGTWLKEHGVDFYSRNKKGVRNAEWFHMVNDDVISMPDKWEYPWYAAWDLAFHTATLSLVDKDFAKQQLNLMLTERYLHPSGQVPAYEWNFNDVNPPVHAFAVLFNHRLEQQLTGKSDMTFLETAFQKLLMNFTWWVNRKDPNGSNVFEGGFLGLDNIGVFDRSAKLPPGISLEQADGTAWMAMYCQNMLEMAIELARNNPIYEEQAIKFFEHFLWIAHAIQRSGPENDGLWDEEDGFFYDLLRLPDGKAMRMKVRSMVGLISLCANSIYPADTLEKLPNFSARVAWFTKNHPELIADIHRPGIPGAGGRYLIALLDDKKLRRILSRMLDEKEFFSPYGIRSLSRYYADNRYSININGEEFSIDYNPAESTTGAFGGNSNWRGPVWFPINALIIRALLNLYSFYGNDFTVECPTGSGKQMNLFEVSKEISTRLSKIFLCDQKGERPVYGGSTKFQTDPYWKDNILFYEYFHGDNGAGLGASHQTGWTGGIAVLMKLFGSVASDKLLKTEAREELFRSVTKKPYKVPK
jgi:hypothetical protein